MKLAIFGAGGLAAETADLAMQLGYSQVVYIEQTTVEHANAAPPTPLDDDPSRLADDYVEEMEEPQGVAEENEVPTLLEEGFRFTIALADTKKRRRIAERFPDLPYDNLIHPSATFGNGMLAALKSRRGAIILPGVRCSVRIRFGDFAIFNPNCTIGHDVRIGDFVTIAPGAHVSGQVEINRGAFIGTGSVILPGSAARYRRIGNHALIGAGAIVTKDVPDGRAVAGMPAR